MGFQYIKGEILMKKNRIKFFVALSLFALVLFASASVTFANSSSLTNEEIEQLRERYQSLGIDQETGEKLIEKISKGELLDSQKYDNLKDEKIIVGTGETQYIEFDDGSRIMLTLEEDNQKSLYNVITPLNYSTMDYSTASVINNSCSGGTGYMNCNVTVRYYDMVWDMKYDAKISIVNPRYGKSSITSVSNERYDVIGYTITHKHLKILRGTETSSSPAKAQWRFIAKGPMNVYEITRDINLYVQGTSTYARLEWD